MTYPLRRDDGAPRVDRYGHPDGGILVPRPEIIVVPADTGTDAGALTRLDRAIASAEDFPVVVAHAGACLAVAQWAALAGARAATVTGALLIAPFEHDADGRSRHCHDDAHVPQHAMPFPTIMVVPAGRIDSRARALARAWSAELHGIDETETLVDKLVAGDRGAAEDLLARLVTLSASRWRRPRACRS